ncbi:hypothetical protein Bca4012_010170 [Brassica carinata]
MNRVVLSIKGEALWGLSQSPWMKCSQNVQVNGEVMDVIEKLKNKEAGEASNVDEKEEKAETESEENSEITDGEDVEQPRKRAKLDTEAVVSAT